MSFVGGIEKGFSAAELTVMNEITDEQTEQARRTVASYSEDTAECRLFMQMLGLL